MFNDRILSKKSVFSVMNEKNLLKSLNHEYSFKFTHFILINYYYFSFLVNIKHAFQDRNNLYLVMDLYKGGDLRFHVGK